MLLPATTHADHVDVSIYAPSTACCRDGAGLGRCGHRAVVSIHTPSAACCHVIQERQRARIDDVSIYTPSADCCRVIASKRASAWATSFDLHAVSRLGSVRRVGTTSRFDLRAVSRLLSRQAGTHLKPTRRVSIHTPSDTCCHSVVPGRAVGVAQVSIHTRSRPLFPRPPRSWFRSTRRQPPVVTRP